MLVAGCVSCQPGFLRLNTKSIRIPDTRIFHQFCIILNKQLPEPSYSITMIHEIQMLYLWDSQNLFQVPTSNETSDFPRGASLLTFPQWMTTNHIFETCTKIISWIISLWSLCISAYCHCVENQDHVSWQRCLRMLDAQLPPCLLCSKRSSTSNWASGYSARREDIGKVVFIQYAIWKKTYIQKFKSAFHLVQYKLQNCLLFHFNYNHM